jgi:thiol-disulfide isomerase/thioredoxin
VTHSTMRCISTLLMAAACVSVPSLAGATRIVPNWAAVILAEPVFSPVAIVAPPDRDRGCDSNRKAANLNFTVADVNGADLRLSAFRGKVIVLNFWATWCEPCKIEIPGFVELYDKYVAKGLVVLGVSVDDPPILLKPFVAQFHMRYPVLVGISRPDLQEAFGPLFGFPTSFVIGRDSRICKEHIGFTPREQFEREIKELL